MQGTRYQAFISYRQDTSGRLAAALEKALRLYAKPLYKPPIRIFRDEKQIGAGQDLRNTIQQALKDSAYLLYIATREAAQSPYVRQELDFWCGTLKRQDRLIIVWQRDRLVADPDRDTLDWAASDAIPPGLEAQLAGIPVWLDLTWAVDEHDLDLAHPRFKALINSIVARFRGVPPEDLNGEEIRVHRRNMNIRRIGIAALVSALIVTTSAGIIAWQQRKTAIAERDRARSSLLVNTSNKLRPTDFTLALGFAAEAYSLRLPEPPPEIAETLLKAFYDRDPAVAEPYRRVLPHGSGVTVATYSRQGETIATGTGDGFLGLWSADGKLQSRFQAHDLKVLSVGFSPDAAEISTTGLMDTAVRRWGPGGRALDPLDYGGAEFAFAEVSATDGAILGGFGGEHYRRGFRLWDPARDPSLLLEWTPGRGTGTTLRDVALAGDGESVVGLVERNGRPGLRHWDRAGGKPPTVDANRAAATGSGPPASADPRFSRPVFGRDEVFPETPEGYWEGLAAGEGETIERFAISSDGQRFLQTSPDGLVRIWDRDGGRLAEFPLRPGARGAALVGDEGLVATLGADYSVGIWSPGGDLIKTFRGHAGPITAIRVSPDAKTLLTASADTTVKLWSLTDQLAPPCKTGLDGVASVRFAPERSDLLLVLASDRRVSLWRPGKAPVDSPLAGERGVRDALFSPDGSDIVTLGQQRTDLGFWDTEGRPVRRCCSHEAAVTGVTFSPDGRHLLTTSEGGAVRLWTREGGAVGSLVDNSDGPVGAQFSPDGSHILVYGPQPGAQLWSYANSLVSTTLSPGHEVTDARFSPDGGRLLLMSTLGGASLWDAAGKHLTSALEAGSSGLYAARWLAGGDAIVTTHPRGGVKVWDRDGALLYEWAFPAESHFFGAAAAPDGSFLVIPGAGIRSLDGDSLGTTPGHRLVDFLPEGMFLLTAAGDDPSEIVVHDRQGRRVTGLGRLPGRVEQALVSPDGRLIAILSDTGDLALRCTAAGIHHHLRDAALYRPGSVERARYGVDW